MVRVTGEIVDETVQLLHDQDLRRLTVLHQKVDLVDLLQRDITDFLVTLSQPSVTGEISQEVANLMHVVNDLERIGDHCIQLGRLVQRKIDQNIEFSEIGRREVSDLTALAQNFYIQTAQALTAGDSSLIGQAQELEDAIDRMEETLRNNHIVRLNTGECTVTSGLIFIDMLHNLEKIGDHTFKLAKSVAA